MKAVLTSIQPYYVFLIIARIMGWNIPQEKTVEVRKSFPKASDWDKRVIIYCTKSKRSFKRIPKEYQPLMAPLLGKVIGEFVCDEIGSLFQCNSGFVVKHACISRVEFFKYLGIPYGTHGGYDRQAYGWHISNLKIYNKPRELGEFTTPFCPYEVAKCKVGAHICGHYTFRDEFGGNCDYAKRITTPPQSWRYVGV